nr:hypothetical protein HmN_000914800 [Hymenolepis microstoma]
MNEVEDTFKRIQMHEGMVISSTRVRFLQISEEVCHPEKPLSNRCDIVVIVKSGVSQIKECQEFQRLNEAFTNSQDRSVLGLRIGIGFFVGLPRNVPEYLTRVLRSLLRLLHGIRIRKEIVRRFEWNINDPSYPNVKRLVLGMLFTKQFPIGDAYFGFIASKLDIPCKI